MKSKNVMTKRVSNNKTPDIIRDNIAVDIGVNGYTVTEVSQKYGISRQSINRWLRNDPTFVSDVERYRQNAVDEKIDALNRVILANIDQQIKNVIDISMDKSVPYSTRLDASKFLINKFIPDNKGKQQVRNQTNTQINIDNSNNTNNKNIEEILKSLDNDNIIDTTNKDDDF